METSAVVDLGFGDSGKGTLTAYLCQINNKPLVVRYSGGHNAGHTVVKDGIRHVFSSFGSGTLQGVPTFWDKKCTFSPTAFLNELNVLRSLGVNPKIFVHGKCPVTTDFDIVKNINENTSNGHGSVGVGLGATFQREEDFYSLLVEDLFFPSVVEAKLELIKKYYGLSGCNYTKEFLEECEKVLYHIQVVNVADYSDYENIIYEGSQGLLLDQNYGFFPHVTRSSVGFNGINDYVDKLYYVTRAYQTRHGNGPMTNEAVPHTIAKNSKETNVDNYQGEFRRTLLDVDLLKYSLLKDLQSEKCMYNKKYLAITCLDHIDHDYRYTYGHGKNKKIVKCETEREFVNNILFHLDKQFNGVLLSSSEEYKKIRIFNE